MTVEQWKNKPFQRSNGAGPQRSLRGPSAPASQNIASPYHVSGAAPPVQPKQKDSVLDKFKLFNSKEKDAGRTKLVSQNKRTSSSSGFSSARSERSDSSASICSDNRPPPPPPHQSVPVSTLSSSSSSDQTHISSPAQQQQQRSIRSRFSRGSKDSKESPRSGRRSEERDPGRGSPRSANRREREKDSREREKDGRDARNTSKLTLDLHSSPKEQCLAPLQEQQSKISKVASLTPAKSVQSSSSNYPSSSSMVQSGIPQAATPGSPLAPGTGIPKPTAAVKGTAKSTPNAAQTSHKEKNGRLPTSGVTPPKTRNTTSHINSDKVMQHQAFDSKDLKGSLTRQKQIGRSDGGVTVAMVSPMPARESHSVLPNGNTPMGSNVSNANGNIPGYGNGNQVTASESASTLSEASQNSCHSTNSNSSGSSVIYRPTSSEDDLDVKIINKHRDVEVFEAEDGDDSAVLSSIKPMQPLMRPAQYMRGIASLHSHYKMGLQEPNNTVPQKGMRMSPHHPRRAPVGLQSPQSPLQQQQLHAGPHAQLVMVRQAPRMPANYSDLEAIDIANGYLSDGDVLRPIHGKGGGDAPMQCDLDGYLSEGGASLYAHKINQRFKEGIRQVQESMSKVQQYMHDDSFDDSSSLSSGVSDSLNEVCGGDDPLAPLAPLTPLPDTTYAKNRASKDVGLKLPVGLSGGSRKASLGLESSRMYKVVSSKAHVVKKTESGQQTDSSAFKQISNTQWKKYVDTSKDPQRGVLDSSGGTGRRLDQKKPGVLGSPSIPSNPGFGFNSGLANAHNGVIGSQIANKKSSERQKLSGDRREADKAMRGTASPQTNGDSRKLQNPKTSPSNFGYSSKRTSISSVSSTGSNSRASSSAGRRQDSPNVAVAPPDARREGSSHSLERPRTKIKVSGGTQTTTTDLPYLPGSAHNSSVHSDGEYSSNSLGRKYQVKSYSLNGPTAAQLSQNVRERIMQSPYGKVHMGPEYNAVSNPFASPYYRERSPRMKPTDGSLSDSPYANYADLQYTTSPYNSPYMWGARSNYPGSVSSAPNRAGGGSLTEAESLESVNSSTASLGLARAGVSSLTQARLLRHQRDITQQHQQPPQQQQQPPPLLRSNSVRSTKSEKIYSTNTSPATLGSSGVEDPLNIRGLPGDKGAYITSQPTSPTPPYCGATPRIPMSPLNSARGSPYYAGPGVRGKDEDCHGSSLSLVSSSSSLYSGHEDKHAAEVLRLRKDLADAQDRVHSLATQLSTNAHVVAAFEHSLTNMTNRLQKLSATSEQKDSELMELRKTIEALRQQSIDAGLTAACIQSGQLVRGTSMESVSSLSSACSATSHTSGQERSDGGKSSLTGSGKKKGWLRSSFTKAFSRGHKKASAGNGHVVKEASITSTGSPVTGGLERRESASDLESRRESCSVPNSPLTCRNGAKARSGSNRHSSNSHEYVDPEEVEMLEEQLREQDMALTDIRLEALTSAHQLESLKETINKMRSEMISLKQDNERLQKIVASKSLTSSQSSLPTSEPCGPRLSSLIDDTITLPDAGDLLLLHPLDKDGKKVNIAVFMGCHGDFTKYIQPPEGCSTSECVIGAISISNKSKWDILDGLVKRIFKEYLLRVDPTSGLGLSADSVVSYHLGEAVRSKEVDVPELLPCGYLVGEVQNIKIVLRGASTNSVDALAFETLIPKSIVQRYVSLLTEHRRIILCGPPGTGKTYLAQKLAEFLVSRLGKDPTPGSIATFNVDPENSKDLGSYLSHISEQCDNPDNDLPLVIILDNLHHAGALTDVFNGFLSAKYTQCPYIIGTMNQATSCSTTNLQLHHNFRWVLMANHMEPVKGVLSRVARRRLTHAEVQAGARLPRLQHVLDWLPKCWTHVNKFLETHSSSDVTLGPRLFLSCPGSVEDSQVWFTDLWNYSLIPYLQEAVREGLQLYGKRTSWEDPCAWLLETYPWPESTHTSPAALTPLQASDVGYDQATGSAALTPGAGDSKPDTATESDPLFNMLLRLQEAANYSAPPQDSTPTTTVALENIDSALESTL